MYATDRHREAVVTLKIHDSFGSPRCGPFVDPSPPSFGFRPIFWEPLGYINEPTVMSSCSDKYFLLVVQSRGDKINGTFVFANTLLVQTEWVKYMQVC